MPQPLHRKPVPLQVTLRPCTVHCARAPCRSSCFCFSPASGTFAFFNNKIISSSFFWASSRLFSSELLNREKAVRVHTQSAQRRNTRAVFETLVWPNSPTAAHRTPAPVWTFLLKCPCLLCAIKHLELAPASGCDVTEKLWTAMERRLEKRKISMYGKSRQSCPDFLINSRWQN